MNTPDSHNSAGMDNYVETACGGRIRINPDTPYIRFGDETIYFCGWDCKQLYDENPLSSCMAARILSNK